MKFSIKAIILNIDIQTKAKIHKRNVQEKQLYNGKNWYYRLKIKFRALTDL